MGLAPAAPNVNRAAGTGAAAAPADAKALNLINNARADLGFHEGANNDNPYSKHVMGDAHQPWCASFVSAMLEKTNIPGVSGKGHMFSASCIELAGQFQKSGRYFPSGAKPPQPGDVIFFGGRGGEHHTGIVEKVENGRVYTIEGNSHDQVAQRSYALNDPGIGGYGRVFGDGQVSKDLGFDVTKIPAGKAGGTPTHRAQGRGTASQALDETDTDAVEYLTLSAPLFLALLEAMNGGDANDTSTALQQLFPYVSTEDLDDVAKVLKANPKLAEKIRHNPDLLKQLVADHSPESVKHLVHAHVHPSKDPAVIDMLKKVKQLEDPPSWVKRTLPMGNWGKP